jgi:hypothetical protein
MQDVVQSRSRRDLVAGVIFIAIAAGFAWEGSHYELGRALRMGPGFMPLLLAALLAVLGGSVIAAGLRQEGEETIGGVPWKAILLVLISLAIFGYGAPRLGLVPIAFLCSFVIALASANNGVVSALAIGVLLAALSWLVIKIGLAVSLPTVGPVFGPLFVP